jgi:hypothetical protein
MGLAAIDEGSLPFAKTKPMILGITAVGVIIPTATDGADPSPVGPAGAYSITHISALVAMPEASQVSSREQR